MKKEKLMIRKILLAALFFIPAVAGADLNSGNGSVTFDSDTQQVLVSTTPSAPTQILTKRSYITRTTLINWGNFNLFLSTSSLTPITTTYVTGSSPFIPATNASSPDGPLYPYDGPMWAVLAATSSTGGTAATPTTITIFRFR